MLYSFFRKQSLRNGPGSIGESARTITKSYLVLKKSADYLKDAANNLIFEKMYEHRVLLNKMFVENGDLTLQLNYRDFIIKLNVFNEVEKQDISIFILQILYFSSADFRFHISNLDNRDLNLVLEVLYEESNKVTTNVNKLSRSRFIECAIQLLCYWKREDINLGNSFKKSTPFSNKYFLEIQFDLAFNNIFAKIKWLSNLNNPGWVQRAPLIIGENLYFGSFNYNFYCVNKIDGKEKWKVVTGKEVRSMPAYNNGVVFFGSCDKILYACKSDTGDIIWKTLIDERNEVDKSSATDGITSECFIYQNELFAGSKDCNLYCIDIDSGSVKWKYKTNGCISSKIADIDNTIIFGNEVGEIYCIDLVKNEPRWVINYGNSDNEKFGCVREKPLIYNSTIIIKSHNCLLFIDFKSGKLLKRQNCKSLSKILLHGSLLIAMAETRWNLYSISIYDLNKNREIWARQGSREIYPFAVHNNKLYVKYLEDHCLHILSLSTGELLEKILFSSHFSDLTVENEMIYLSFDDGAVTCTETYN